MTLRVDEVRLDRPVFIIGSARSGTTLVRACLERSALWRLGRGSQHLWAPRFHPFHRPARDHRLDASDATPAVRREITVGFAREVFRPTVPMTTEQTRGFLDRVAAQGLNPWYYDVPVPTLREWFVGDPPEGPPYAEATPEIPPYTLLSPSVRRPTPEECTALRIMDKDPAHAYRVPFLEALFPDARFVFVVRDGRAAISSLLEAWRHPRWFFSYRLHDELRIAGYSDRFEWGRHWWNLQLPPDWQAWTGRSLPEVCAWQWRCTNEAMLGHARRIVDDGRGILIRYEDLLADPRTTLRAIADAVQIPADVALLAEGDLPEVAATSKPAPDKWRRNAAELPAAMAVAAPVQQALGYSESVC